MVRIRRLMYVRLCTFLRTILGGRRKFSCAIFSLQRVKRFWERRRMPLRLPFVFACWPSVCATAGGTDRCAGAGRSGVDGRPCDRESGRTFRSVSAAQAMATMWKPPAPSNRVRHVTVGGPHPEEDTAGPPMPKIPEAAAAIEQTTAGLGTGSATAHQLRWAGGGLLRAAGTCDGTESVGQQPCGWS